MKDDLQTLLDFTKETAYLAGRFTLGYYQSDLIPDIKKDGTVVTQADKGAEQLIRQRIEKHFPSHEILGRRVWHTGKSSKPPTAGSLIPSTEPAHSCTAFHYTLF